MKAGVRGRESKPKAEARRRLDQLVVERGLASSRQQAQALILAGRILVNGQKAQKAGHTADANSELQRLGDAPRYASRAGAKLEAALDHFGVDATGRVALDVGSSTGGFTDCLLARGARCVYAIDSGSNQMIWRLRTDPRVRLFEHTNARYLTRADLGLDAAGVEPPSLLVMDVSFISATVLLPVLLPLLDARGVSPAELIILVKPQFEAGRAAVGKGGIVRDPDARLRSVERVAQALAEAGVADIASLPSPVLGAEGNQEYLVHGVLHRRAV